MSITKNVILVVISYQRGFIPILMLLVVALLAGYLIYQKQTITLIPQKLSDYAASSNNKPQATPQAPPNTAIPNNTPKPSENSARNDWEFYDGPNFKFVYPSLWQVKSCCGYYNTYTIDDPSSEFKFTDGRSHKERIGYKSYIKIHYDTKDIPASYPYYAKSFNLDEFLKASSENSSLKKLPMDKNIYAFKREYDGTYYLANENVLLEITFEEVDQKIIDNVVSSATLW